MTKKEAKAKIKHHKKKLEHYEKKLKEIKAEGRRIGFRYTGRK